MNQKVKKVLKSLAWESLYTLNKFIPGGLVPIDKSTGIIGYANFAVANDPNTMAGDFKNLYKDSGLVNNIPSWMIIQDRFAFEEAEAGLGQFYVFGVVLQKEHGVTYAPSSGVNSGVQTLNPAVAGFIGSARLGRLVA